MPTHDTRRVTLADALGEIARPLARVAACWARAGRWRVAAVRLVYPALARALDDLVTSFAHRGLL